ncbi:MFS transporter [Deinococcus psychrotolerans]|uniref:MFS transporter n=1 Tax=Deinococcus psychrotolerans TaxID=2489213 RepID=A0A3G8Y7Y2_9DEIO|nr:MFS transporter [Deinococcus psychrotolerans]AZI41489.1 MFS transporter [Deinococcus psychrotolerans]
MLVAAQAWRVKTFRALRHPNYRRYWFSQLLSLVGSWMQSTAQSYLVLELTNNNAAALGWVTAAQFTPSLLLSLFAGAIVDRVPRRRVLMSTQITLMITAIILAITTHLGLVSFELVLILAGISGIANAFDMPARQSMVVDFVPREDVPNAVALNSLSFNVSRTLGQAVFGGVAALGVALFAGRGAASSSIEGLAFPFYLNVVSFGLVIYVLATLPFPAREVGGQRAVIDDIKEGLRYVRATPNIAMTMVLVALLSLTAINFNVIIPYFARAVYNLREGGFGAMNAAFGVGAMVGALWQASQADPAKNLRSGAIILIISLAVFALTPSALLASLVLAVCGFGMLTFLISANSTVQLTVPNALRGRVMSLYSLVLAGMGPPGALLVSYLIDKSGPLGPRQGLIVVGVLALLAVVAVWRRLPKGMTRAETPLEVAQAVQAGTLEAGKKPMQAPVMGEKR